MSNHVDLSVVIPAYDEEHRLPSTLDTVLAYLDRQPYSSELVAVDAIRVPFQLNGIDGLDVVAMTMPYSGSARTASIRFGHTDDDPDAVTVTVQRPAAKLSPNATIAGHPAVRDGHHLTLLADLGQNLGARAEVSTVAALDRAGGEPGLGTLLASVRIAGDPDRPETWPTDPVR